MRASGENLAGVRAETLKSQASPFKWAGLVRLMPTRRRTFLRPASPLKRAFCCQKFHLTARKRLQLRNACTDALAKGFKDGQTNESGADCAHCHPACEAAIGRPDPLQGCDADLSEGRLSTSLLTASGRKAVIGWNLSQGKRANYVKEDID